jgi:hypothetical protein
VPQADPEVAGYILGVWTGLNVRDAQNGTGTGLVGQKTDVVALIEEVRLLCRQHPSMRLTDAVFLTWDKILGQEEPPLRSAPR